MVFIHALLHYTESLKSNDIETFCLKMRDSMVHSSDIEHLNINIETSLTVPNIIQA